MNVSASRIALVFATVGLVSIAAHAAPPPAAPPTPGQVQSSLPTQQQQPVTSPTGSITQPGPTPSGVAAGGPAIKVAGFDIHGNSVIPASELQAQISSYVGKSMTLAELYDVADVLTRYYRGKGYGLAYVSLPAQTLSGGTVKLEVIEGRVGKIGIQGNNRTRTEALQKRAAGLKSGDIYTDGAAQRAVLLMNDLPGVEAHAVLSPGADYGSSDMLFDVNETHYSGDTSVDDYGRSVIGRWRVSADFNIDSVTGRGDQLSAGITHSDGNRLNFGKLGYSLPVGEASTLSGSYNRAEYHGIFFAPGGTTGLPFGGSTQNAVFSWQYPETRSASTSLFWNVALSYDNSRSKTYDPTTGKLTTETLTSNLTLLQLGGLYSKVYSDQSALSMTGTLWTNGKHYQAPAIAGGPSSTGITAINHSDERARLEFDTSYTHPFAEVWSFVGQANLSYSVNTLTDADKFNLGGPNSVLGYQSAEQRGDSGYFLSTEVQRMFALGTSRVMAAGMFLDTGKVWDKAGVVTIPTGTGPAAGPGDTSRGISSGGLDLQLLPNIDKLNARLQWAYAIGRRPADGNGGGHIWLTIGMTF